MSVMKFRRVWDAEENEAVGLACATSVMDESLAQQQFKDETDLNVLLARYGISDLPPVPAADPRFYGDLSDVPDLRTLLDVQREAQWNFNALPAPLRARFGNSMAELWSFVNDPANADEAVRLGLLVKKEEPAVAPPAPVVATSSVGVPGVPVQS